MKKTRQEQFQTLRDKGWSLQRIGDKYKLSRERVRQILLGDKYKGYRPPVIAFERPCVVCKKVFMCKHDRHVYCDTCSPVLAGLQGRERTREAVRIRDKRTCQSCGKVWNSHERRFDVHHLNGLCGKMSRGYDSIDTMEGLTTLCHRCHIGNHARDKIREAAKRMTNEKKEAVIILSRSGFSQDKIAKVLGITQTNISKYLNSK